MKKQVGYSKDSKAFNLAVIAKKGKNLIKS